MIQASYKCSQQELYTIATLGWSSCSQHLSLFTGFKPKYNAAFISDNLSGVESTKELPDDMQRTSAAKIQHIQLVDSAKDCRSLFQKLKRYIASTWPPAQLNTYYDTAGQPFYASASNDNWDAIESLLNSASAFALTYQAALTNNDNMPASFTNILTTAKTNFSTLHQSFLDNEETATIGAYTKIEANNALFIALMSMFLDGQEIFRSQPAIRNQFIFDHCLFLVRGVGTAGVRGTVSDAQTTFPVAEALITVGNNQYTTLSDIDGQYQVSPTAAGTYSITITADGYQTLTIPSHQILTGTISTLNILLSPII